MNLKEMKYSDFPYQAYDKIRFADTDQLGHVNNAVISTFLETGRCELLLVEKTLFDEDCTYVIVKNDLNFISEILWPGTVEIGTVVTKIGNSAIHLYQCIFQNDIRVADANTIMVQMNVITRHSSALTETAKTTLQKYLMVT